MYVDITTALAGIKTMTEFATLAAKSKKDSAVAEKAIELNAVIIDLQSAILSIQAQNQDLLQRNNELEQKIAEIENWNATAEQYTLTEIALGVFVYTNKKNDEGGEPSHWLCTNCYQDKKKSIIQRESSISSRAFYVCPNCKHDYHFSPGWFGNKQT
jgi:predicted enzyme involved in methoxymalonyl-ACP biosynthesis